MVSAAAEDALGACCAGPWAGGVPGGGGTEASLGWPGGEPVPKTMVSVQPASPGHLFPATWTSERPDWGKLCGGGEHHAHTSSTMLCLPIGQAASSLGEGGGGRCFRLPGSQPRGRHWEQGLMPKMDCAAAGIQRLALEEHFCSQNVLTFSFAAIQAENMRSLPPLRLSDRSPPLTPAS